MKIRDLLFLSLLALSISTRAQRIPDLDSLTQRIDSVNSFSLDNLFDMVIAYHPVAKQALLLPENAQQEIRLARGAFDPKMQLQFSEKQNQGTEYYRILNGGVKFPTRFPIDPSIGIEQNRGRYLNPERYISAQDDYSQVYAGVSVPLGRGLITDERRALLNQAVLLQNMNEAEKVKAINKLLLEAAKEYWNWYYASTNYELIRRNKEVAEEILRRVKTNLEFGEVAVVDTIQAAIAVQQREVELREALIELRNSRVSLSTFLWDSLGNPLELAEALTPQYSKNLFLEQEETLLQLKEQAMQNHPELQKVGIKLKQLEIDRKLASEFLKPELNVNYYFLNKPISTSASSAAWGENYKFGLDFSFPVFLRKERSKLALTKLKISSTTYEQADLQRKIEADIDKAFNRLVNIRSIIDSQRTMVNSYERLIEAELINVEQGESDLFKINVQLEKLLQSQSKLLKLMAEFEKEKVYFLWAAGVRDKKKKKA